MPAHDALLILFVKHPRPGAVKTRLAADIGTEQALAVYQDLLAHLKAVATPVQADKVVFYGDEIPADDLWAATGWPRQAQEGPDLGARMAQAFAWGHAQGYRRMVLVGSDLPQLSTGILETALHWLQVTESALGRARDGGYYLIGLRQPLPAAFAGITWSTPTVAQQTLDRLLGAGLRCALLPLLSDVDTAADLPGTFLAPYLDL